MSTWTMQNDEDEQRHLLLMLAGFALLLAAAFVLYLGMTRGQWPVADAQVLTVEVRCQMDANGYSRSARRSPPVVVPCNQVERFRADNPHRSWTMQMVYSGQVRVIGDGDTVTVYMGLGRFGRPPRVGDVFEVVQNPENATDVSFPDRSLTETIVGACLGGLGAFVLGLAFFLS